MNELWADFIESDVSLIVARTCRYFGINPLYFIEDEVSDRYEQLQILEAMMLRDQSFERQQAERDAEERERKSLIDRGIKAPGTAERVEPPSPDEVLALIQGES